MDDSVEEFEPLFDYRRVQPVNFISLDDDDDDSSITPAKRRKLPNPGKDAKDGAKKGEIHVIDCDEIDDVDDGREYENLDWLIPPPFISSKDETKHEEGSTIAELRRKREELASFAKSTEDVLRALEESAKREHEASSRQTGMDQLPKASSERAKIVLSVQDKDGQKQFRVYADDKFESFFKMYAERIKVDVRKLVFTFDGEKINPTATPHSLEMEDEDLIEVIVRSTGDEHEASLRPSSDERAKIVLSMQDKEGQKQFRVYADDKFESFFKMYAAKIKADLQKLVFTFDGEKISPTATPQSLEMEDGDLIEVIVKSN